VYKRPCTSELEGAGGLEILELEVNGESRVGGQRWYVLQRRPNGNTLDAARSLADCLQRDEGFRGAP
jgi:hypothetical protein